jgi:hypothetical protein
MSNSENETLQMLKQIDRKLERVLDKLSDAENRDIRSTGSSSLLSRARQIAALTPRGVTQTNTVVLLHEDRQR